MSQPDGWADWKMYLPHGSFLAEEILYHSASEAAMIRIFMFDDLKNGT